MVRTGATFADAAAEFLRYAEHDRGCKPSTLRDYRSNLEAHLLPAFGAEPLESITTAAIDRWRARSLTGLSNRTKNKLLVVMHGVFRPRSARVGAARESGRRRGAPPRTLERRHRGLLVRRRCWRSSAPLPLSRTRRST